MAIEPIKGFYVYDEETDTEGISKYDYNSLDNTPDVLDKIFKNVKVNNLEGATFVQGMNGVDIDSHTIGVRTSSNYNSYIYYAPNDFQLYIDSADLASLGYVSVCIVENAGELSNNYIKGDTGTAKRYRKSDNNMPSLNNSLSVPKGSALIFTEPATTNNWSYRFDTFFKLKEDVSLDDAQIEQVKNDIVDVVDTRKCKVRYIDGASTDASTERLEIFVPTVIGYVCYSFMHCVHLDTDVSYGHQDIWRVAYAYAYDDDFNLRYALTTGGEWELALHLKDRTDFSGGHAHGDEIFTDLTVLVDGAPLQYDSFTSLTDFETLTIVERSNLYDPADNATIIAEHGSEHIFDKNGLTINQSVKWLIADQTTSCYMAMFPVAKPVSDKAFVNTDYIVETLPKVISKEKATSATIYSDTLGVKMVFEIDKYPLETTQFPAFLCTDNGGGSYNKCYYVIVPNQNISVNERWESTTVFKIAISK